MKGIFPYDKQELILEIPKKALLNELQKNIQLSSYIPIFKDEKSTRFFGTTMSSTWKISLKTNNKNSFKPIMYLKLIEEGENRTRMILEFKLHIVLRVFMLIFMLIPISIIINNMLEGKDIEEYYFPVSFIGALFILSYAGFYMSLDHSAEALNEILRKIIANSIELTTQQ